MNYCTKCGAQLGDTDTFCTNCGAPVESAQAPQAAPAQENVQAPAQPQVNPAAQPVYQQPYYPMVVIKDPKDHTDEFTEEDISKNKITAMAAYILGVPGIIIALLASSSSEYAAFHVREALKLSIADILLVFLSVVLCWTFIVPILGGIASIALFVVKIICFFSVAKGQAKNAPIVGNLPFFK
ncbi:MAG: zinc-ribbon domain-containing protein [Clostridia bacterium]|nr:zinc-ribbon domain-containing protein [Clostridia bacterium]